MYIGDFEELVKRNEVYPNIRFVSSRWGKRQGAPEGTCTVLVGAWPMTQKYGKPYLHPDHKGAYNVPIPFIPRHTIENEDGSIQKRGWESLLKMMLYDNVIRYSDEIRKVLESNEVA